MTESTIGKDKQPGAQGGGSGSMPAFLVDLARNAPAMMWTFTATTFLSALLLFAIQPLFAKTVLPVLGGSPSVWSVSVFFFQAALLAGYLYAHLLIKKAPAHLTGFIHLAVCLVAVVCLPIGMSTYFGDPPQDREPYLWQLATFTVSIGLPFVAVSANAPLLQAWFARSGHPDARDPYFMYAASNLGSLVALLGYPFVLEPLFGLSQLKVHWTFGYGLLVLAIAGSFFLMRGAQAGGVSEEAAPPDTDIASAEAPTWTDRLKWIGLAFVPAALVTAFTVHITTDVASAPLLWVIPLALYLLTFVLVFGDSALTSLLFLALVALAAAAIALTQFTLDWVTAAVIVAVALLPSASLVYRFNRGLLNRPLISREALLFVHLVALVVALVALTRPTIDWFTVSFSGGTAFLTTAMLAHRTLYEARPAPRYLTEFYLWMSFGGALGGMFTALVAPKLFIEIYEYPLLLALSMACRPGALTLPKEKQRDELIVLGLVAVAGALLIRYTPDLRMEMVRELGATSTVVIVLVLALLAFVHYPARQLVAAVMICAALVWLPSEVRRSDAANPPQRSYFGVYRMKVEVYQAGFFRSLVHGTTLHGSQRLANIKIVDKKNIVPIPVDDTVPTTYYYPKSPIGLTIAKRRELLGKEKGTYGVVGLGTGSSACHKQEGETWRFFEIDPLVMKIAKDPKNFTFISRCQPDIDIKIGDARLTIEKEEEGSFDLFVIDAFTSDAIPVHMLTKEAVELFLDKLKPDGVVLLHTSNRHLDLEGVLASTLLILPDGTAGLVMHDANADKSKYPAETGSSVVIFAKSEEALKPYRSLDGVSELVERDPPLRAWTDDYSDILGAFLSRKRGNG